jgi:signal transduction histidine kinase
MTATLPEAISHYLGNWLARRHTYSLIRLASDGRVVSWNGDLNALGITEKLQQGRPVEEQLDFTEGLLPAKEPSNYLPMITIGESCSIDLHLIKEKDGYVLLLMGADKKIQQVTNYQQQANEFALWKEGQTSSSTPQSENTPACSPLVSFFKACDTAALQSDRNNKFTLIGEPPRWLYRFCPDIHIRPCGLNPDNSFGFLDNFLEEARRFWSRKTIGRLKSGIWIEVDEQGREYLFEAAAIHTGAHDLLLISNEDSRISEKQDLIQKARELALGHASLKREQNQLQLSHDDLKARINAGHRDMKRAQKRLDSELVQRRQLEQERTEILLQLQQAQKMEAIGTLAGGIAHDFNNILSAVIGYTELSLFNVRKDSSLSNNLHQVLSAAQRAKELIRQILTFSRQSIPETRPICLNVIIKEALKLLRASLPATVELNQDLQSNAYVMADPTQLHQVVMNLCTNASHALVSDGGVIDIILKDREITANDAPRFQNAMLGSYIELNVKDNGSGMTKDVLHRIFDPFFTTKKKGQGTGMGLSVVHGIIQNCKGDISVTSRPGKGTLVSVILPRANPTQLPEAVSPADLPKGVERVLFVDDEPSQTDLALQTLPSLGYHVTAMTDGIDALKLFEDSPDSFDIVITDMYMPKITGKQLATHILKIRPKIPIILSSGYSADLVPPQTLNHYFKGHLMKPFLLKEMAQLIRNVLDQ